MQPSQQVRGWRRLAILVALQIGALSGAALWGASRAHDLIGGASRLGIDVVLEHSAFRLKLSAQLDLGSSI